MALRKQTLHITVCDKTGPENSNIYLAKRWKQGGKAGKLVEKQRHANPSNEKG